MKSFYTLREANRTFAYAPFAHARKYARKLAILLHRNHFNRQIFRENILHQSITE